MLRKEASIPSHDGLSVCLSSKYFDFLNKDDWEKDTELNINMDWVVRGKQKHKHALFSLAMVSKHIDRL